MASKDIQAFADGIDSAIKNAINVATSDYEKRFEAIEGIVKMPDAVMQLTGSSRDQLIRGAEGEMQRVQKEQCNAIEAQIQNVESKLSSLKGNATSAADIKYLTEKLSGWIKKFDDVSVPNGPHSRAFPVSATTGASKILEKWEKFCDTDPTIKKAALYEEKARLENEINSLSERISGIEKSIPALKAEYDDRTNNSAKFEQQVRNEVENEVERIATELRHAEEDLEDLEKNRKSVVTQLESTGLFAFGKKKELKIQLEKMEIDIASAKSKVQEIERKKQSVEQSLGDRIADLAKKVDQLRNDIESEEANLERSKEQLSQKQKELADVGSKL